MTWVLFSQVFLFSLLSKCDVYSALSPENTVLVHSAALDPEGKFQLLWNFDDNKIVFEVQVQTLGYVGFGLSPNGDMPGSDIVIGGVRNGDGDVYFTDRHATGRQEPIVDESQDWDLLYGSQSDTHTTLRFWRPLDTCDDDDRPVQSETVRVIWAYGDEDADSTGTAQYHSMNRGSKNIFLLNPQKKVPEIPGDSLLVDFLNNQVEVPESETTYWCQAFSIPILDRKHHVIKFEAVIHPGLEHVVHHMVLVACDSSVTNETMGQGDFCYDGYMPRHWWGCTEITFAWATGGGPFYFPEHVGFPFGFDGDPDLLLLQTHFDNPTHLKGLIDSSGLRLTLSPRPRKYDAGLLTTGLVYTKSHVIPPFSQNFKSKGHCVPQCLTQAMGNHTTSINFFAGFLHSHLIGTSMSFRHFRGGVEQKPILQDKNYDFNFQETRIMSEESIVLPGDHLFTECDYRTTHKDKITFGGEGTNEEMCLTFALYYPRIPVSNCQSMLDVQDIAHFAHATLFDNMTVREPEEFSGTPYSEFLNTHVNWRNKTTRDEFQKLVNSYDNPVRVWCFVNMQNLYPILGKKVLLPQVKVELSDDKECDRWTGGATTATLNIFLALTATFLIVRLGL